MFMTYAQTSRLESCGAQLVVVIVQDTFRQLRQKQLPTTLNSSALAKRRRLEQTLQAQFFKNPFQALFHQKVFE